VDQVVIFGAGSLVGMALTALLTRPITAPNQ
jgi:hypothetical protein